MRPATFRVTPLDESPEGYLSRTDLTSYCGGMRQAIEEILQWPTTGAAKVVAVTIFCRQWLLSYGGGDYARCSFRTINRYLGKTEGNAAAKVGVKRLLDQGLLWAYRPGGNKDVLYYYRKPERPAASSGLAVGYGPPTGMARPPGTPTPTAAVPAMLAAAAPLAGLALADLSKSQLADVMAMHGGFLGSVVATAQQHAKAEKKRTVRGDTPLVYSLCEILGHGDRWVWCSVQATATRAKRAGDAKGTAEALAAWVLNRARSCVRDDPVNPAAVFVAWFRNQPMFAKHWKAQTEGASDG